MAPKPPYSLRGLYERLFVTADWRWGARRWQPNPSKEENKESQNNESYNIGYRLEECGPKGLEHLGRDEIRKEALRLSAKQEMTGPWAI
jgi:hypothetical protein